MKTQPLNTIGNMWERKIPLSSWTFWSASAQLGTDIPHSHHTFSYTGSYKTFWVLLHWSQATVFAQQSWLRVHEETQSTVFTWSWRCISLRT